MAALHVRRAGVAVLSCLAALSTVIPVPAAATAAPTAPAAPARTVSGQGDGDRSTSASTRCVGGGRVALTLTELATDGSYRVEARARNMPAGSRWRGYLAWYSYDDFDEGDFKRFREPTVDGRWTASRRFGTVGADAFEVFASSGRDDFCLLVVTPDLPAIAFGLCRPGVFGGLVVSRLPRTGETVVRFLLLGVRPKSRWRLTFNASDGVHRQSVRVADRVKRSGFLFTKAFLDGYDNPRVFVQPRGPQGQRCGLGLDPRDVTADAPSRAELRQSVETAARSAGVRVD